MKRSAARQAGFSSRANRIGSTLILCLVLVGVLAISVAAMLSSVRHLARSADDKIAEEECYQAAMAGLNCVKAWMMNPALAGRQHSTAMGNAMESITSGAELLSRHVYTYRDKSALLNSITADQIVADWFRDSFSANGITVGSTLITGTDGNKRIVFYDTGANQTLKPLVIRRGEADFGTPSTALFNASKLPEANTPGTEARSWVERIRISTPWRNSTTPVSADDLRLTTLIIEVQARTAGAGIEKERTISGRVLVIPQVKGVPPAQSGAAIVAGSAITMAGNNDSKISWGSIWAKGTLAMLGFTPEFATGFPSKNTLKTDGKYTGVGSTATEKWVRYLSSSKLVDHLGNNLFPATIGENAVPVTDLVAQIRRGEILIKRSASETTSLTLEGPNGVSLIGMTPNSLAALNPVNNLPLYYDTFTLNDAGEVILDAAGNPAIVNSSGPFVQDTPRVAELVDLSFDSLDYTTWKNFAVANLGYVRPKDGGGFTNAAGQTLYVTSQKTLTTVNNGTPFTSFAQISMQHLVPTDGNTAGIPDRILFIDTYPNGTAYTMDITSSDKWFWKGLMYVNGHLKITGSGDMPTVWGKNPDHYYASPPDPDALGQGEPIAKCCLDGILRITGQATGGGNASIFGSIVAGSKNSPTGFQGSGTPDIYYNQRCKDGLFRAARDPKKRGIVSGPIIEQDNLPST